MGDGDSRCPRCGAALPSGGRFCSACGSAATRFAAGEILDGKYEILGKLAEGGMGEVYRARHVHLDEIRIIKVTKPELGGDGADARRFAEEARLATLVRHPNVAALYDFSRLPDGSFYMVWEYIDGVTLEQWLRKNGAMPPDLALPVARQVLSGLAEIHAQGIVHRDLSPDNILLKEGPGGRLQAKIIDLGIAKRIAAESLRMTGTGLFVGKLKYCSPEQAGALRRGESLDGRSDLYSFGAVLYEMLAGKPLFEAATPEAYLGQHLNAAPPRLELSTLPVPAGRRLAETIGRALEKDRARRFPDADEFRRALEALEPAVSRPTVALTPSRPRPPRPALPVAIAAGILVLVAAAAIYAIVHWPTPARRVGAPLAATIPAPAVEPTPVPSPEPPVADVRPPAPEAGARPDGSRRGVADPAEAGVVHRPPARTAAPAAPAPERPAGDESADAVVQAPPMDARAGRRLRALWDGWNTLPTDAKAREARYLARFADRFVASYPDDPLSGELRQRLPESLAELARRERDANRPRLAARFYAAYRDLAFAPADAELDRLFEGMPAAKNPRP